MKTNEQRRISTSRQLLKALRKQHTRITLEGPVKLASPIQPNQPSGIRSIRPAFDDEWLERFPEGGA
jgi:hypothetical protein